MIESKIAIGCGAAGSGTNCATRDRHFWLPDLYEDSRTRYDSNEYTVNTNSDSISTTTAIRIAIPLALQKMVRLLVGR